MKKLLMLPLCLSQILFSCNNGNNEMDASGVFEATEITVSAKGLGEISEFNLQEGDEIKKGDVLGYIDTTQLHFKKIQLKANLKAVDSRRYNVTSQIAAISQQIATQKKELVRFQKLVKANASNQKQVDDIQAQILVLEKQLAAQTENLQNSNNSVSAEYSSIEAQIAQIEDQIHNDIISSPVDGTVLAKYAQQGEVASQGRALYKLADISNIFLRVYVTAGQLTSLKLGQSIKVYADQGENDSKEYNGKIVWISDKAEFTPKTIQTRDERANLVYAVKIAVKNDGLIKRGMYGDVKFK